MNTSLQDHIKNGEVINMSVFQYPTNEQHRIELINALDLDDIVLASKNCTIGSSYDGSKFWLPKPYPSWIKDEELNEWVPPIPRPPLVGEEDSIYRYEWDEENLSWIELQPNTNN